MRSVKAHEVTAKPPARCRFSRFYRYLSGGRGASCNRRVHGGIMPIGGWGGIRTPGALAGTPVFKTGALNHSATHPKSCCGPCGIRFAARPASKHERPKARHAIGYALDPRAPPAARLASRRMWQGRLGGKRAPTRTASWHMPANRATLAQPTLLRSRLPFRSRGRVARSPSRLRR